MGRARPPAPLGPVRLGAAVAVPCLVVSLALGLGLIYLPPLLTRHEAGVPVAQASTPGPPSTTGSSSRTRPTGTTTTGSTTTGATTTSAPSTSAQPPPGFTAVEGPHGLVTSIPQGFEVELEASGNAATARDPADPAIELRFGGGPPGATDLATTIAEASAERARTPGYEELERRPTTHHGAEAVDWEFLFPRAGQLRWWRGRHWRAGGVEYVLLAGAPPERRSEAARLLAGMIEHSRTE